LQTTQTINAQKKIKGVQKMTHIRSDYRRITSILSPFTDFSNIDASVLKNAADRGTRVHKYCELHAKGLLAIDPEPDAKLYVDSFMKWFDIMVDNVLHIEKRIYCDQHMITGQVDLIVKFIDEPDPWIIDIKTPQKESKTWRLQTAAYLYLAKKVEPSISHRACLQLDKNGGIPSLRVYPHHAKDMGLFFDALRLVEFFNL
jgi:hypothetical protein